MGIDYMQGSGMLVTLDQMFSLITKDNYKTVMWSISHAGNWMDEYTEQDLTELQELPFRLEKGFSYKQFMEWFEQFHAVTGEAGKYGGDCSFENGFYIINHIQRLFWSIKISMSIQKRMSMFMGIL